MRTGMRREGGGGGSLTITEFSILTSTPSVCRAHDVPSGCDWRADDVSPTANTDGEQLQTGGHPLCHFNGLEA
jgi:hypothetical protein